MIGDDLATECLSIIDKGEIPEHLNETLIVLIPKVNKVKRIFAANRIMPGSIENYF